MLLTPEEISLDQFRDDWRDRELEVPFLAKDIGMNRHVLTLNRKFHRKRTNLDHLADIESDRKRNHVAALVRVPVTQHVGVGADPPSVARQVSEKVLNVHRAHSLRARPAD